MKKTLFIIATMLTMGVTQSNAQSFLDVLKGRLLCNYSLSFSFLSF